jgi:anti-sigma-K factor RskA
MTDARPLTPREEDDAFAAEYVLGVLDLADRARAEDRIRLEPVFAGAVAAWELRLSGLNDEFADVPAPNLLPKIDARLFPAPARPQRSWLGWLAGAGVAAAIALAALMLVPGPVAPELVATLQGEGQPLVIAASYADGVLSVARSAGPAAAAGSVYELWLIDGDNAPVSLGLIDAASVERPVSSMPEGAILAISLEPSGGSTTGAPTGPVLVTGVVQKS